MKVLLVNTYHYMRGGDSTYTFALAELLRSHGHEVFFFAMKHPRNLACDQEGYFVDQIDFVEQNRTKNLSNATKVLTRSIYSRQARERVARLLEDVQPDVIHLQNIHGHITPSILYEFESRGLPVFWTLHDYKLICPNTVLLSGDRICEACKGGRFHQCTMRKCKKDSFSASLVATAEAMVHRSQKIADKVSRFVSPSRFLLQKFREFGWVEDRLVHVRNFLPSGALDGYRYNDTGYGVYLGRLEPPKGVASFLKASSLVKGLKIKIVGEGNQRSELEQMATTLGLADVEFSGYLAGEELKEMLQNCSFVVVPSEWYENCPYSVMEAMAAGKPVVASAIGGLPELIEDGVTGFLFEMGNHVALAERMRTLAKGSVLRREMGARAYEKARAEFAPDRHYRALMDVYCSRV